MSKYIAAKQLDRDAVDLHLPPLLRLLLRCYSWRQILFASYFMKCFSEPRLFFAISVNQEVNNSLEATLHVQYREGRRAQNG